MLLSPVYKRTGKKTWENFTIYEDGYFYAFFGSGRQNEQQDIRTVRAIGLDVYRSADGIHFEQLAEYTCPIPSAHAGFCVKKIGEYFYYYPTCTTREKGIHFKIYRTKDFQLWEHLGDEYDVYPDPSIYRARWDELVILEEKDEQNRTVYYGYISSEPREDIGEPGPGMLKSYDGIHWEILPPAKINWGETPSQHMEMNFIEKIDGHYYLSMTGRLYMDSFGYSIYVFEGNTPFGPFSPITDSFRLAGCSRRDITWLGHTCWREKDLLLALWLSHDFGPEIPSRNFAMSTLKKVLCQKGRLRLGFWEKNRELFDFEHPLNPDFQMVHPAPAVQNERDSVEKKGDQEYCISASRDGVLLLSEPILDRDQGLLLEGSFLCQEKRTRIHTHHHAAGAGFFFEEKPGFGTLIFADTLGTTRTGTLRYADHAITDEDIYRYSGYGLVSGRNGVLRGTSHFTYEDTVGPYGHASFSGIRHNRFHTFKVIARLDYFELYIDDLYVQTYLLPESSTGRIGIFTADGTCDISVKAFPWK